MQSAAGSRREGATEQAGGCRIRHGVQCLRFSEPWSEQSQNAGPFGIADCDKQARSAAILAAPVPAGSRRYDSKQSACLRERQFLSAKTSRPGGYGEQRGILTAGGIKVKMSVAYGNERAGVRGVELSLGRIAQSDNPICGCRADSKVNSTGVASAAQHWLFFRNRRLTLCREPLADYCSSTATMFMKRSTVTGRIRGRNRGKSEIQVAKTKQVIRSVVVTDAFLAKSLPKRLYL